MHGNNLQKFQDANYFCWFPKKNCQIEKLTVENPHLLLVPHELAIPRWTTSARESRLTFLLFFSVVTRTESRLFSLFLSCPTLALGELQETDFDLIPVQKSYQSPEKDIQKC